MINEANIKKFTDLVAVLSKQRDAVCRKRYFDHYFVAAEYRLFKYLNGNVYVMKGAVYSDMEFHIAEKLTKAGFHVIFPSQGDFGKGKRHDVYLCDTKTCILQKVEMKSFLGTSVETLKKQMLAGSLQSTVIAYDIQSKIKKLWLIRGLQEGWTNNLQKIMLNYKGKWYEVDKKKIYSNWLKRNLK